MSRATWEVQAQLEEERDQAREEMRYWNRVAGIYGSALSEIAEETGTPYGTAARKALDEAAAFDGSAPTETTPANHNGPRAASDRKGSS